jgi:hypothetical protein
VSCGARSIPTMTFLTTQKPKKMSFYKTYASLQPKSQNVGTSWLKPMYIIKNFKSTRKEFCQFCFPGALSFKTEFW